MTPHQVAQALHADTINIFVANLYWMQAKQEQQDKQNDETKRHYQMLQAQMTAETESAKNSLAESEKKRAQLQVCILSRVRASWARVSRVVLTGCWNSLQAAYDLEVEDNKKKAVEQQNAQSEAQARLELLQEQEQRLVAVLKTSRGELFELQETCRHQSGLLEARDKLVEQQAADLRAAVQANSTLEQRVQSQQEQLQQAQSQLMQADERLEQQQAQVGLCMIPSAHA